MIGASRFSRIAFAVWTALIILFLFFPIIIIMLYAFNPSNVQSWPLSGLSTRWFSSTWHNAEMRQALWLSVRAGLLAFALSFDEIVVTTFTAGAQNTLPIWIFAHIRNGQQLPQVNVVVLFVILISVIPVTLAQRLTRDTGAVGRT